MMHAHPARARSALSIVALAAAIGIAFAVTRDAAAQAEAPADVGSHTQLETQLDATVAVPIEPPSPRIVAVTRPDAPAADAGQSPAADSAMRETAPAEDVLAIMLDHAKVIRLPERTQTVIVGNPFIADVAVQRNGIVIVTGKSYGATNLIALDAQGLLLAESMVSVRAPDDSVVLVQRGLERESYSCTPDCQPSLRLGDSDGFFGAVGGQATQRSGFATQAR